MIAAWMLYCALCALGLCIAAIVAERLLLARRGPVRQVWIGAVALALLVPATAYRVASRPNVAPLAMNGDRGTAVDALLDSSSAGAASSVAPAAAASPTVGWSWRVAAKKLARADRSFAVGWAAMSLAFAVYFVIGIIALAWMRRRWPQRRVLDVRVLVSERTGPAVVGALSPAIVLPEWALAMEQPQLALMLRHEQEHRRAGDGRLLTAAHLALIAMPWNAALWWMIVRMRMAIELDCDARVLRDADARSYGDLLLEVARPRRGPRLLGATAFVERAAELERRIRFMARRGNGRRGARALAVGVGVLSVTVAWVAPRPPAPARSATPRVTPTTVVSVAKTPVTPPTITTRLVADSSRQVVRPSVSNTPADVRHDTAVTANPAPAPADTTPPQRGAPAGPPFVRTPLTRDLAGIVDTVFHRLFDGIALTADQETKARDLLMNLAQEQAAQDQIVVQALTTTLPKRAAVQAQRDSALRALLTTDGDRAAFDARVAPPGGGGRSGGPGNDSLAGGRGGRGGGGGRGTPLTGGRGPGRGASPAAIADAMFHRLFDGLALTPVQEGDARAIIAKAQDDLRAFALPVLPLRLGWRSGAGGVAMQAQSDSAFAALLANDGDRATLHARVIVVPLPPGFPQP